MSGASHKTVKAHRKGKGSKPRREDELLPTCEGPKMHPFRDPTPDIEFLRLLSVHSDDVSQYSDESGGTQGHVFLATVNAETFALKLFKFFHLDEARLEFGDFQNEQMTDEDFKGNIDPFFAECRAYGRVEEFYKEKGARRKENDVIAVPCYGYLYISLDQENVLREKFRIADWNRPESLDVEGVRQPIRALVKKFLPTEDPVDTKERSILRMVSDLRTLHSIGVYPRDISARNYRGGLIVDFGSTFTEPSCVLKVLSEWQAKLEKYEVLKDFDKMIKILGVRTIVRAGKFSSRQIFTRAETAQQERPKFVELDSFGKKARPVP